MSGGPLPVREFASVEEMRAHAAALKVKAFQARPELPLYVKKPGVVTMPMVKEIRRRRALHEAISSIARVVGVAPSTVRRHTRDIPPPEGGWGTGGRISSLSLSKIQRMRRAGFTYREIGADLGCSNVSVWRRLNGSPPRNRRGRLTQAGRVLQRLCDITGLHRSVIRPERAGEHRRGKPDQSRARHIYFWILVRKCGKSLPVTGALAGGFDHTSVLYGVRRVDRVVKAHGIPFRQPPIPIMEALWAADWKADTRTSLLLNPEQNLRQETEAAVRSLEAVE